MGSGKLAMVSRIRFRHKREIPEKGCGPTERTVNLFQGLTAGGGGGELLYTQSYWVVVRAFIDITFFGGAVLRV